MKNDGVTGLNAESEVPHGDLKLNITLKSFPIKCDPGSKAANFQLLISEERKVISI